VVLTSGDGQCCWPVVLATIAGQCCWPSGAGHYNNIVGQWYWPVLLASGAGQYCAPSPFAAKFGSENGPCFGAVVFWLTQQSIIIISAIIIIIISIVEPDEHQGRISADVCLQMLKSVQKPRAMLRSVLKSVHKCRSVH
jgi:hypothetical protein